MGKCQCCGQERKLEYLPYNLAKDMWVCEECDTKIDEMKYGKYTPEQIITEETTDLLKEFIIKRAQEIKEKGPDLTVSAGAGSSGFTCSAASGVNVIGIIFLVVCIIATIVLLFYSIFGGWLLGIAIGAVAVVTGIFIKCLCSCIAIITENQYRELMKK